LVDYLYATPHLSAQFTIASKRAVGPFPPPSDSSRQTRSGR